MEGTQRMDRQLLRHVCDALDRSGFRMRDGDRGLLIEATAAGVRVSWRPDYTQVRPAIDAGPGISGVAQGGYVQSGYGQGIKAAMAAALVSVLEQAGCQVHAGEAGLLVTGRPGHVQPDAPGSP